MNPLMPIRLLIACKEHRDELEWMENIDTERLAIYPHAAQVASSIRSGKLLNDVLAEKVREYRCHVVLLEATLIEHEADIYASICNNVRPAQCILMINTDTVSIMQAMWAVRTNLWLTGSDLSFEMVRSGGSKHRSHDPDVYGNYYLEAIAQNLKLDRPSTISSEKFKEELKDEINYALGHLFTKYQRLTVEPLNPDAIAVYHDPSAAPRIRSALVRITFNHERLHAIVKIAMWNRIRDEVDRYDEYIDNQLSGLRYARVEGHILLWNIGAVAYSLIGGSEMLFNRHDSVEKEEEPVYTLTDFYKESSYEDVCTLIPKLFSCWERQYWQRQRIGDNMSIFQQYDKTWNGSLAKRLDSYKNQTTLTLPGIPYRLLHPVHWLAEKQKRDPYCSGFATWTCIGHGDLHADNVFVDSSGYCWFIDFERCGYGPLLQDFVELEADILTRLVDFDDQNPEDMETAYQLFIAIAEHLSPSSIIRIPERVNADERAMKAIYSLNTLRACANDLTQYQDSREYLWGTFLNSIFRATYLAENGIQTPQANLSLLLGSILCKRLELWQMERYPPIPWPPKDWPQVKWIDVSS